MHAYFMSLWKRNSSLNISSRRRTMTVTTINASPPSAPRKPASPDIEDVPSVAKRASTKAKSGGSKVRSQPAKRRKVAAAPVATVNHFQSESVIQMREALLEWFDSNHRVLPWRSITRSKHERSSGGSGEAKTMEELGQQVFAYRVWVSEVMLQQTQVATVIDYFNKWMQRWPTIADLAGASDEDVKAVWAGLGYYRRASYLLQGAKHVVAETGGVLPATAAELCKIPGIGPYTAAAVSSIVFGQQSAAVDGNVMRVMARLCVLPGTTKDRDFLKAVGVAAEQALHPERPGDWNQAVMELGATVCKPAKPACAECCVREHCQAYAAELAGGTPVTQYPEKAAALVKSAVTEVACVLKIRPNNLAPDSGAGAEGGSQPLGEEPLCLLLRRPDTGLLAGMWEVPCARLSGEGTKAARHAALEQRLREVLPEALGEGCATAARSCGQVGHVFTHINMTVHVYSLEVRLSEAEAAAVWDRVDGCRDVKLVPFGELGSAGVSTLVKKVIAAANSSLAKFCA